MESHLNVLKNVCTSFEQTKPMPLIVEMYSSKYQSMCSISLSLSLFSIEALYYENASASTCKGEKLDEKGTNSVTNNDMLIWFLHYFLDMDEIMTYNACSWVVRFFLFDGSIDLVHRHLPENQHSPKFHMNTIYFSLYLSFSLALNGRINHKRLEIRIHSQNNFCAIQQTQSKPQKSTKIWHTKIDFTLGDIISISFLHHISIQSNFPYKLESDANVIVCFKILLKTLWKNVEEQKWSIFIFVLCSFVCRLALDFIIIVSSFVVFHFH